MQLAELVSVSDDVAATRSRLKKVASLAGLLRSASPDVAAQAISYLSGELPQGKIGVGYSMVYGLDVDPAVSSSIEMSEIARALDEVKLTTGAGSKAKRVAILTGSAGEINGGRTIVPQAPAGWRAATRRSGRNHG